jgi:hypothetical protein
MTRVELRDEIVRKTLPPHEQAEARGLFGVARSMLASVVESGLNLPDAAKLIRGEHSHEVPASSQSPVATVTLAEIYAAQGHRTRALRVLEDVLAQEPDHEEALRVKALLLGEGPLAAPSSAIGHEIPKPDPRQPPFRPDFAATTEYVPGGFLDTTGEEIQTGKPPAVESAPAPPVTQVTEHPQTQAAPSEQPGAGHQAAATQAAPPPAAPPQQSAAPSESALPAEVAEFPLEASEPPLEAAPEQGVAPQHEPSLQAEASASAEPESTTSGVDAPLSDEATAQPFLILAQKAGGLSLYWELPRVALRRCSVDEGEGTAALRLVGFSPSGPVPGRVDKTIPLGETHMLKDEADFQAGSLVLDEFGAPLAVRAALGWESEDGFLPLTVGRYLEECLGDRSIEGVADRAAPHLR